MTLVPKLLAALAFTAIAAHSAASNAYEPEEIFGVYDQYQAGYDDSYGDDWFFDYYEFDPDAADPYYDYYTGFDYGSDLFEWEEERLFR